MALWSRRTESVPEGRLSSQGGEPVRARLGRGGAPRGGGHHHTTEGRCLDGMAFAQGRVCTSPICVLGQVLEGDQTGPSGGTLGHGRPPLRPVGAWALQRAPKQGPAVEPLPGPAVDAAQLRGVVLFKRLNEASVNVTFHQSSLLVSLEPLNSRAFLPFIGPPVGTPCGAQTHQQVVLTPWACEVLPTHTWSRVCLRAA